MNDFPDFIKSSANSAPKGAICEPSQAATILSNDERRPALGERVVGGLRLVIERRPDPFQVFVYEPRRMRSSLHLRTDESRCRPIGIELRTPMVIGVLAKRPLAEKLLALVS